MNKTQLVAAVQRHLGAGTSRAMAERAIDAMIAAIEQGLKREKEVQLVGFGTFSVSVRPARRGFNPHTRRPMTIPAVKTVRFRPGARLRAHC